MINKRIHINTNNDHTRETMKERSRQSAQGNVKRKKSISAKGEEVARDDSQGKGGVYAKPRRIGNIST